MTTDTTVLILDEDHFFADGLRCVLTHYATWSGKRFRFVRTPHELVEPFVVFFTLSTSHQLPQTLFWFTSPQRRLIGIVSRRTCERISCPGLPWIPLLHREAPHHALPGLLFASSLPAKPRKKPPLSPQEIRVCRHLASGRRLAEIARLMARSEKTISAHKCRAMTKLGLRNTRALQLWLNGPGCVYLIAGVLRLS
ncbi:LuxR C-terminal-related transcriptional regulator [Klebsiella aerogenes]|nr:LuxR C-terminal-related transcriptional regulator [Klebsiella aerogenes]